ncbi:Minor histocompatibility antigen H13 (Intramembrane protease 1) (IMP-1) (IMPAS-1) (hIMP1) (Presenilin-like protein 3) (Signal peptide peptidase) [Durusdinium trenchii]|uniref:Minor histocompatibility antigen H13 (Intramembrane protease 1) (IMP-1) (IMPAS-1) (HIMP1) (Presenilin-like protein 3) (Signal peptide peptidase) n=1 Tax=Durusdinium trenchii TaxID=1381693 RepID=A0ABP0HZQ7_9DINO
MPTSCRTSSPKPKPCTKESKESGEKASRQSQKLKAETKKIPRPSGLQSSLLRLYGSLGIGISAFAAVAEMMRHQIPTGHFELRDGRLINISHFDPLELGPFPKCHPHFGEHRVNDTWVKIAHVPAGGPFLPGHPQNPEWLEKSRMQQKEDNLTWKSFQSSLHMVVLASLCVLTASKHSLWTLTEPAATQRSTHTLEQEDAYWLPLIGSGFLFAIFLGLKYLSIDWLKEILQVCILSTCAIGVGDNAEELWQVFGAPGQAEPTSTFTTLLKFIPGFGMALAYAISKHWMLNNIMGLSFCLMGIRYVNLSSFRTGVVLLAGLFLYDVFWVFLSKPLFGANVMVSVAKGIEAPMKLLLPRDCGGCGDLKFGMLGLGDIAVPGLFTSFLAKWDAVKMSEGSSTGFIYLNVAIMMYILSLAATIAAMIIFNHAQPALLYICPGLLLGSIGVAFARAETSQLLTYSLPGSPEKKQPEEEEAAKKTRKRQLDGPGGFPEAASLLSGQGSPTGIHKFAPGNPYLVSVMPLLLNMATACGPAFEKNEKSKHVITQDSWRLVKIEPEVQDIADHFGLDERITGKLQEALNTRPDPGTDLEVMWEILDEARNPPGLTMIKVKEMLEGTFRMGEQKDAGVQSLAEKFKLDERAAYKLSEVLSTKPNKKDVLKALDVHLAASNNPSALVMLKLADLRRDVPLGEVPYGTKGYRDRPYLGNYDRDGRRIGRGEDRTQQQALFALPLKNGNWFLCFLALLRLALPCLLCLLGLPPGLLLLEERIQGLCVPRCSILLHVLACCCICCCIHIQNK